MDEQFSRIIICGADEIDDYRDRGITHLVRVMNPGVTVHCPPWFMREYLCLSFGDVVSEADALACRTRAPGRTDIMQAIDLGRRSSLQADSRFLVSCDYGASRSPALVYVMLADRLGPGREGEALEQVLRIRPDAVPNAMVVTIGDELLGLGGALLRALQPLFDEIRTFTGLLQQEWRET